MNKEIEKIKEKISEKDIELVLIDLKLKVARKMELPYESTIIVMDMIDEMIKEIKEVDGN